MIGLQFHNSAVSFLDAAEAFLLHDEAANCLLLGITARLRDDEAKGGPAKGGPSSATLVTLSSQGDVILAAMQTPPHNLVLSLGASDAIPELVGRLNTQRIALPGVNGPAELSTAFARMWASATAVAAELKMQQRIHRIEHVEEVPRAQGQLRPAVASDVPTLAPWSEAFDRDAHVDVPEAGEKRIGDAVAQGRLFVWEVDDEPVSMAAWQRKTQTGVSINLVYTPPDHRRRGYATACVAALSQQLLDEGRAFCCLFTDLANPTSNAIYRRIGYRPVCDFASFRFVG